MFLCFYYVYTLLHDLLYEINDHGLYSFTD